MGKMILRIYDIVEQKAGMKARIKLVEQTGISRSNADIVQDDEEIIKLFKELALKISGINVDDHL